MENRSSTTTPTRKPTAREVAAFTDAELDQYLDKNNRLVIVDDPDQLPESFIERLRDRARPKAALAIDLDQVNTRLWAAAQEPTPPHERSVSYSRSPTSSPSPIENNERQQYEELIRLGGRPCYPIDLIDDIFHDPTRYRDLLQPFLTTPSDWKYPIIFTKQVGSWDTFRSWQKAVRGYRGGRRGSYWLTEECIRALQAFKQACADTSLTAYAEAARRTVFDHYSLQYSFQPAVDPLQQDELSTWLEYLVCKHWQSECCNTQAAIYRRQYDTAWQKLLTANILNSSEIKTREIEDDSLQTAWRKMEIQLERDVIHAEAALLGPEATKKEDRSPSRVPAASLEEAKTKLEYARARLGAVDEFLGATAECRAHGQYWEMLAETHTKELPWVLQQLPMVSIQKPTPRATAKQKLLRRSSRIASQLSGSTSNSQPLEHVPLLQGSRKRKSSSAGSAEQSPLPDGNKNETQTPDTRSQRGRQLPFLATPSSYKGVRKRRRTG